MDQADDSSQMTQNDVFELVHAFFVEMDAGQWSALKSGNPDFSTKFKLAQLLMNIVAGIAKSFLGSVENLDMVSERLILSSVEDTVPQTFGLVLNVKEGDINSDSKKKLTSLVGQEVTQNLRSSLSGNTQYSDEDVSCRLCLMVHFASKMIKDFLEKVFCNPCSRLTRPRKKQREAVYQDLDENGDENLDTRLRTTAGAIQEIVLRDLWEITEPILGDLGGGSNTQLLQLHFQAASSEIAEVIHRARCLENMDSTCECANYNPQEKCFQFVKVSIRRIFAKYIFKTLLQHGLAQVESEFKSGLMTKSSQNFLSNLAGIPEDEQEKTRVAVESAKNVYGLQNIKLLSDLMYDNIQASLPQMRNKTQQEQDDLYVMIANRIRTVVKLVKWWLTKQGNIYSEKLAALLIESLDRREAMTQQIPFEITEVELIPGGYAEAAEEPPPEPIELNEINLQKLVKKLVFHIYSQADIKWPLKNPDSVTDKLFQASWAAVANVDLSMTASQYEKIVKGVFKKLLKKLGPADNILVLMTLQKPVLEEAVALAFKNYLLKLKNNNCCFKPGCL